MKPTLLTLADVDALSGAEFENIAAKAILRTGALAEKFYPAVKADTRSADVLTYNEQHYDNAKSPVYGDLSAAAVWAALKGIEFKSSDYTHEGAGSQVLTIQRGVVLVPVNTRTFQWPEDFKLEPIIATQQGTRQAGWFRNAAGEKVAPVHQLTTLNSRPATREEILAVVKGNMDARPNEFIRNLGDSLPGGEPVTD